MKNFIHKVQDLSKKAAELKQVIQSAPAKAAEVREALTMTAGELHQLRVDVQQSMNGLRANGEDRLLQSMREINDNTYTFEEAGYELTGMDLDLHLNHRLAVHFQKFEDVPHVKLRALINKETRETIKSILAGLLKAEESAANVEFTHLKYDGVVVHIGATPLIRMCWRSDTVRERKVETATVQQIQPSTPTAPQPSAPAFGSFFEQRVVSAQPGVAVQTVATSVEPVSEISQSSAQDSAPAEEKPLVSPWSSDALSRFKKMPDLSKHR